MISERTIGRLSLYRRILEQLQDAGQTNVFSHELAEMAGSSSAQVRRDLMAVAGGGTPAKGYNVEAFLEALNGFLAGSASKNVGLIGVGNLGRALLAYFAARKSRLAATAAFDRDEDIAGRVIHGCRVFSTTQMQDIIERDKIDVMILAVPAGEAQRVADEVVAMGVRGIMNFAPTPLQAKVGVYVENIDLRMALEKVAFFAHHTPAPDEEDEQD